MSDKKLYDDIKGKRSRRDQTMLEVMALFDEQKDETNEWQRRAEWLAEQLALAYCKMYESEYDGLQEPDKTADYWLKRAGEEA